MNQRESQYILEGKRVWVAGHSGMVGSAVVDRLSRESPDDILLTSRAEVDLTRQDEVEAWVHANRPEVVLIAAAKVGGILENDTYPANFLYDNLMIEANIIHSSAKFGVDKLLFLGSSCIYPKFSTQPIKEECLLSGPLEPTNEWYAIAKIAGIKLCQAYRKQYGRNFISVMPSNLYGPNDNFDLNSSHVLPALMRKMHDAKERGDRTVKVWGTGKPKREFLHVKDMADGCVFILKHYNGHGHINLGSGYDLSISKLAGIIKDIVGFSGGFIYDEFKPDGTPRKLLDSSKLRSLGWRPTINLRSGITETYEWFLKNSV